MPRPVYPAPPDGVTQLSKSDVSAFLKCGIYYWDTKDSDHRFASIPMLIGSAVAGAEAADSKEKMAHGRGLRLAEILESAIAAYEKEREECEVLESKLEIDRGRDDAVGAARAYATKISPLVREVLYSEDAIVAQLSETLYLAGTPDKITPEGLGDTKAGREWTQARADRANEIGFYGLLYRARMGRYPSRLWVDSIYETKNGWMGQRFWTHRGEKDYEAARLVLERVAEAIKAGIALPAPELSYWCSRKYCPRYRRCPAVQGAQA